MSFEVAYAGLYVTAIAKRGICLLVVCKFRALNLAAASQAHKPKERMLGNSVVVEFRRIKPQNFEI